MEKLSKRRWLYDRGLRALLYLCGLLVCALLVFLIGYIFVRGLPLVTWELLSTQTSMLKGTTGILPHIASTIYIIVLSMAIVLPLGVGAAIYLTEYASNRRLAAIIEFAAETLTGIPSIIFGLVGMMVFIQLMGLKAGILAGGLTLAKGDIALQSARLRFIHPDTGKVMDFRLPVPGTWPAWGIRQENDNGTTV